MPAGKDQLWYGDITYIFTMSGWAYLATVIDGYSRKVVGWSVADNMREEMVIDALAMAVPEPGSWYRRCRLSLGPGKPVYWPGVPGCLPFQWHHTIGREDRYMFR